MKLGNIYKFWKPKEEKSGTISDFFLHATEKEKEEVFSEAAHRANDEQMEVLLKSQLKAKGN